MNKPVTGHSGEVSKIIKLVEADNATVAGRGQRSGGELLCNRCNVSILQEE